jgi:hypothetical protein
LPDAPEMKEISLFALPPEIDATRPFTLDAAQRAPVGKRRGRL